MKRKSDREGFEITGEILARMNKAYCNNKGIRLTKQEVQILAIYSDIGHHLSKHNGEVQSD